MKPNLNFLQPLYNKISSLPILNKINLKYEFRFWLNFSCFGLMVLWLIISILTTNYQLPFIAWHTITGHHYLVLLFGFVFPFFYLWIKKGLRPLWSFVIIAFTISVSEWLWWITYFISHYVLNNTNYYLPAGITSKYLFMQALSHLTIYNSTGWAYIIVLILFFYKFKIHKAPLLLWFFLSISIFGYWLYLGFPITVDFSGVTVLFTDFNTNLIENLHWLIPNLILIFGYELFFNSVQNSSLKGLPPIIFKLYFQGKKTTDLIDLEKFLMHHPHYKNNSCKDHISCSEYEGLPSLALESKSLNDLKVK